ncbi:peptidase [Leptolyngbya sp. FACHB-261]|uniref:peptidase n=1 Tax=Leptolyngbya sp. FACHB-261 TaxID=2692806 RepID=UPI0016879ADB|nr:peptidase [Leptolyngbya sp. FACHB-261]MBD2101950.1 peptidase [Leptolyngbya sp. FACHB-261]
MTYCLGLLTQSGLVFTSDSRTNAGVDSVATYAKLFDFSQEGDRVLVIMTSGNLSSSQSVMSLLKQDLEDAGAENLHNLPSMYAVARYLGSKNRTIAEWDRPSLESSNISFSSRMIVGGQIKGQAHELYLIYTEGNCIQATPETPFLQLGETKYGKPILDRAFRYESSLEDAARCALISMDATMRSNLGVGPPIEIVAYTADSLRISQRCRLGEQDEFLINTRRQWEQELQRLVALMPPVPWDGCGC